MPNQIPDDCPQGQPDARPAPARSARLLFKAATHAHSTRIRAPGMRRIEKFLKYNPLTRAFKRRWCRWRDSNPRPPHYECDALPAELHRHCQLYAGAKLYRLETLNAPKIAAKCPALSWRPCSSG